MSKYIQNHMKQMCDTLRSLNRKCGECQDYLICKSDYKVEYNKYLPKHKKACKDFKEERK